MPIKERTWRITAVQDQDTLIESVQPKADLGAFPFGLMLWASAVGLAERLVEEPETVAGKRVLKLGAGVGLPGLARLLHDSLPYDLVITCGVLYERILHESLAELLPKLVAPSGAILLADPLRPQALEFLEKRIETEKT